MSGRSLCEWEEPVRVGGACVSGSSPSHSSMVKCFEAKLGEDGLPVPLLPPLSSSAPGPGPFALGHALFPGPVGMLGTLGTQLPSCPREALSVLSLWSLLLWWEMVVST